MNKVEMNAAAMQEIAMLPEVLAARIECAQMGEAAAKAIAPVSDIVYHDPKYGHYKDSIHVEVYEGDGTVLLIADDFKANWVEFGTLNPQGSSSGYPAHATLRRGMEAAGFRVTEPRRR